MKVAIVNQKGGVGKTTTAVNLATALANAGHAILLVDLDPQANATTGLGIEHRELDVSVYDVLIDGRPPDEAIISTRYPGLDLIPSSIDLAGAELELVPAFSRESKLRVALESLEKPYEAIFIDCPPSLGLLTVNALTAADWTLVPIQCEYYALEGLSQLMKNVELVRAGLNPRLEVGGILLTMYDARTKLSEQVAQEVRSHFGERVFETVIPRSVRLSEAPSHGEAAVSYDPSSRGSLAYRWLSDEFAKRHLRPGGGGSEATRVTAESQTSVPDGGIDDAEGDPAPAPGAWVEGKAARTEPSHELGSLTEQPEPASEEAIPEPPWRSAAAEAARRAREFLRPAPSEEERDDE